MTGSDTAGQRVAVDHRAPQSASLHADLLSFQQAVSASFVPLKISTPQQRAAGEPTFKARLVSNAADCMDLTEVQADPHQVERTQRTIDRGGSGYYKVSLLLEGTSVLVQDGRELVMQAGDLTVYDTSRPYSLLFTERFRNLVVMFPKDRLELPVRLTEQLTAVSLSGVTGVAPVTANYFTQLPQHLGGIPAHARAKLGRTGIDLIDTLFSELLGTASPAADPRMALLQRIHEHIDTHLSDSSLSPGSIAAAHYISLRHLHSLFAESGQTVSSYIKQRRLERASSELANPALVDYTVAAIARRSGFVDAAHFSRAFKAHFEHSPSEFRAKSFTAAN